MYELRIFAVMFVLILGCGSEPQTPPVPTIEQQIAAVPGIENINKFIDEKDPWTKFYNAWDFVKTQATLNSVTDYDSPVHLTMYLANLPTEWSRIEGFRKAGDGQDKNTMRIEACMLGYQMPWAPANTMMWNNLEEEYGQTNMLEWKWLDKSDDSAQKLELWFRMKDRKTFVAD